LVTDTKIIQEIVLNKVYDFCKPKERQANSKAFLGEGLLHAEGETHKKQIKMMNPAFTHNNIKVCIFFIVVNII